MTKTELCNRALSMIGASLITDFETDNRKEAQDCRLHFEPVSKAVQRSGKWTSGLRRAQLAQEVDPPVFGYSFAYTLPEDALKVWQMADERSVFAVENGRLLTDEVTAKILYQSFISDPTRFDPGLSEAVVTYLASVLALSVLRDETKSTRLYELYLAKLTQAAMVDGQESSARTWEASILRDVR